MRNTPNYNLPQYEGTDKFTKEVLNDAFSKVDTAINDLQETFNINGSTSTLTTQEVVNARNGKQNLKERIDEIDEQYNEIASNKIPQLQGQLDSITHIINKKSDETNWGVAINRCINELFLQGGGNLLVPLGTFDIDTTSIKMRRGVKLKGVGTREQSVIKGKGKIIIPYDYNDRDYNISIENLTIESDKSNGSVCIDFSNITNSYIKQCTLKNADFGIYCSGVINKNGQYSPGGCYYNTFNELYVYYCENGLYFGEACNTNRVQNGVVQFCKNSVIIEGSDDIKIDGVELAGFINGIILRRSLPIYNPIYRGIATVSTKIIGCRFESVEENATGIILNDNTVRNVIIGNYYSGCISFTNNNTQQSLGNVIIDGFENIVEHGYDINSNEKTIRFEGINIEKKNLDTVTCSYNADNGKAIVHNFKEKGVLKYQLVYKDNKLSILDSNFKPLFTTNTSSVDFEKESGNLLVNFKQANLIRSQIVYNSTNKEFALKTISSAGVWSDILVVNDSGITTLGKQTRIQFEPVFSTFVPNNSIFVNIESGDKISYKDSKGVIKTLSMV